MTRLDLSDLQATLSNESLKCQRVGKIGPNPFPDPKSKSPEVLLRILVFPKIRRFSGQISSWVVAADAFHETDNNCANINVM
jgi:hypothetical protein